MSVTVNVTNQYITFEIVNDGPEDLKRFYTLEYFESVHMHEHVEIYIQRPEEKRMVGGVGSYQKELTIPYRYFAYVMNDNWVSNQEVEKPNAVKSPFSTEPMVMEPRDSLTNVSKSSNNSFMSMDPEDLSVSEKEPTSSMFMFPHSSPMSIDPKEANKAQETKHAWMSMDPKNLFVSEKEPTTNMSTSMDVSDTSVSGVSSIDKIPVKPLHPTKNEKEHTSVSDTSSTSNFGVQRFFDSLYRNPEGDPTKKVVDEGKDNLTNNGERSSKEEPLLEEIPSKKEEPLPEEIPSKKEIIIIKCRLILQDEMNGWFHEVRNLEEVESNIELTSDGLYYDDIDQMYRLNRRLKMPIYTEELYKINGHWMVIKSNDSIHKTSIDTLDKTNLPKGNYVSTVDDKTSYFFSGSWM